MISRLEQLAARRERLVAQSDALRARLAGTTEGIEQVLRVADLGVAAGRYVRAPAAAVLAHDRGGRVDREAAPGGARHQLRSDRPVDLRPDPTDPLGFALTHALFQPQLRPRDFSDGRAASGCPASHLASADNIMGETT